MSMFYLEHPSEKDLALFAGGELGPVARWRIESHLQSCTACEEVVADFFHLQSEVGELADLPPVDWDGLAQRIGEKVAVSPGPRIPAAPRLIPSPVMWRLGLATATLFCAFVVVRQLPFAGFSPVDEVSGDVASATKALERSEAPAEPLALAKEAGGQAGTRDDAAFRASPLTAIPAKQDARNASEPTGTASQSASPSREAPRDTPFESVGAVSFAYQASQVGQTATASADVVREDTRAASPPAAEAVRLEETAEQESLVAALPRRSPALEGKEVGADKKRQASPVLADAITPPPAPVERRREEADELDKDSQFAQVRSAVGMPVNSAATAPGGTAIAGGRGVAGDAAQEVGNELAQAAAPVPSPRAKAARELRSQQKIESFRADSPAKGFSVLPAALDDSRMEIGVAADGWVSFRSLDERTGTITITDVYLPQ